MWRDTALQIRVFSFDARVLFAWVFASLGFEIWKLTLALLVTVFFKIADFYGYTPVAAWRAVRFIFAGKHRPPLPRMEYRRYA